jgi:hypothetical protein
MHSLLVSELVHLIGRRVVSWTRASIGGKTIPDASIFMGCITNPFLSFLEVKRKYAASS